MADAAKSDEIEDVLSSIRRLVSEHQPPARSEPARAQEPPATTPEIAEPQVAAASDRLILTPALRVTDPEDPWVPITPRAEEKWPGSQSENENPDIARDDGADWAKELWAEAVPESDSLPDTSEDHAPDPQLQADQWEAGISPSDEDAPSGADDGLTDPIDVTEALLHDAASAVEDALDDSFPDVPLSFIRSTSSVSDYEPEEDNAAMQDGDLPTPTLELAESRAAHADPGENTPEETPRVKVEIVRARSESRQQIDEDAVPDRETVIAEDVAQQVAAELAGILQAEADAEAEADEVVTDFLASDAGEPDAPSASPEDVEDLGESPFTFPDDGESFVDEAALREIIAEVVRDELQGEMGVRITRNVRRLVRREIRLALAARDVE